MALDNGTIQHPLPGDLQARVENALNLVTSLEAEEARLRKMIGVNTQKINELHEEQKATEALIKTLKGQIPDLEKDVEISKGILNELESQKTLVNNQVAQATDHLKILQRNIDEKYIEFGTRQTALEDAERNMNDRHSALAEKESAHSKKVERLLEAIK